MIITGIGCCLPQQKVENRQLESILDTSDEWIRTRTGICARHIIKAESLTDLAAEAAREALKTSGLQADQIDYILCATTQGDCLFPSLGCLVQGEIGANCPASDIHAACTGFLYALDAADALLKSGRYKRILVVCAEAMSRLVDWTDRGTCVLFGDGAAAVVLEEGEGLLSLKLSSDCEREILYSTPSYGNCPFTDHADAAEPIRMKGQDVFKFAVTRSLRDMQKVAEDAGIQMEQVDYVLLHQANRRILDAVSQRLKLGASKMPTNIHRLGNTSAASIPLLLCDLYRAAKLKKGSLLMFSAFGGGLTSGACLLRWQMDEPAQVVAAEEMLLFGPALV